MFLFFLLFPFYLFTLLPFYLLTSELGAHNGCSHSHVQAVCLVGRCGEGRYEQLLAYPAAHLGANAVAFVSHHNNAVLWQIFGVDVFAVEQGSKHRMVFWQTVYKMG